MSGRLAQRLSRTDNLLFDFWKRRAANHPDGEERERSVAEAFMAAERISGAKRGVLTVCEADLLDAFGEAVPIIVAALAAGSPERFG